MEWEAAYLEGLRGRGLGAQQMRYDVTSSQLALAADGLEEIAATCSDRRRADLVAIAADLRERAFARRRAERARSRVLEHAGLA